MMQSPSAVPSSVPPKQLQSFNTSLPEKSESIGGQSHEEWMEIEMKKFKARQAEMWAKIRQEREALQIKKDKVIDSGNKENSVIGKAESSSIYSESIKSKEASIIEKGHGKHSKAVMLDFSEVNGTYFLPYEFRAIEIDELQEQEQVAEESLVDKYLQTNDARNQEKNDDKALGSYPKAEQDILQITPPSRSPNIFQEVCLAINFTCFQIWS